MDNDEVKIKYGWTPELENFFKNSHPQLLNQFRGSFRIKEHKGNHFWYYRLSSSKERGRDKYLCSVDPKGKPHNLSSFQHCCNILLNKVQSNFTVSERNQQYLHTYLQLYKDKIESEGISNVGRNYSTTKGMLTGINDFKSYCINNDIRLNIVPTNEMKTVFRNYLTSLSERNLSRGTIKSYVQDVRYFLEWLVKDKLIGGLELFPSQPITIELQNKLIEIICGEPIKPIQKEFRKEYYEKTYNDCLEKVRTVWSEYCNNDGRLERIRDKNGKINQPPHFLGMDVVYFVSLLQLRGGFRVGEVFYSYRNRTVFNEFHLRNQPKEMGSFWERNDEGWVLRIRNSKNKDRDVPINDTIWSWVKPPEWIKHKKVNDVNGFHYETDLIDVIMELFPTSYYTFPSPNHHDKPNQRRSITYYMNMFKKELVINMGWDRYGITSSHDLRSLFISYSIQTKDITPFQICEITGHTISVMEKYYIRENLQSKLDTFKRMGQRELIRKNK